MVLSQFSFKILGVYFGSFVLDNFNYAKISHILAKKKSIFGRVLTLEMKKKRYKSNPLIQTLIYRSNTYYSKIYDKVTWKNNSSTTYLLMRQGII